LERLNQQPTQGEAEENPGEGKEMLATSFCDPGND
jgi:hypothetical protein